MTAFGDALLAATVHPLVGTDVRDIPSGHVGTVVEAEDGKLQVQWALGALPSGWSGARWSWVRLCDEGTAWEQVHRG